MRVLLKLSGEVLSGEGKKGYDSENTWRVAQEVHDLVMDGNEVGVVIGAGNILRGEELKEINRIFADQMGMLATVMNSIYLKEMLEKKGVGAVVFSSITRLPSVEPLDYSRVEEVLRNGGVAIFAGGTSNPLFTTDTAAALRAAEMGAKLILKATKVDGVYDRDPKKWPDAKKFDILSFDEAIRMELNVMDIEAFSICKKAGIEIVVYNFFERGSSLKAIRGKTGSRIVP